MTEGGGWASEGRGSGHHAGAVLAVSEASFNPGLHGPRCTFWRIPGGELDSSSLQGTGSHEASEQGRDLDLQWHLADDRYEVPRLTGIQWRAPVEERALGRKLSV